MVAETIADFFAGKLNEDVLDALLEHVPSLPMAAVASTSAGKTVVLFRVTRTHDPRRSQVVARRGSKAARREIAIRRTETGYVADLAGRAGTEGGRRTRTTAMSQQTDDSSPRPAALNRA